MDDYLPDFKNVDEAFEFDRCRYLCELEYTHEKWRRREREEKKGSGGQLLQGHEAGSCEEKCIFCIEWFVFAHFWPVPTKWGATLQVECGRT